MLLRTYKCLTTNTFQSGKYQLVPLRDEDKFLIRQWRNEQIYHLRQAKPLTEEDQIAYFKRTVAALFEQEQPNQILFSYLEDGLCIGYGGLVHINWIDKNAEVSFVINTMLEKDFFELHWLNYLSLLEKVAFETLKFHKLFTFAFDLRPHLYVALEKAGFQQEAVLKDHCFWDGHFIRVIIHSKMNWMLFHRRAENKDVQLYFEWANDETVRKQSFQSSVIEFNNHQTWFQRKLKDPNCVLLVFENDLNQSVGQVRLQKEAAEVVIGISVAKMFRGKGLASKILKQAVDYFSYIHPNYTIKAFIKETNIGSIRAFEKAGFTFDNHLDYQSIPSVLYKIKFD